MPQATDELREKWDGPDDYKATEFLYSRGYTLTRQWEWVSPNNKEPDEEELSAILFMIQEWDYGSIYKPE